MVGTGVLVGTLFADGGYSLGGIGSGWRKTEVPGVTWFIPHSLTRSCPGRQRTLSIVGALVTVVCCLITRHRPQRFRLRDWDRGFPCWVCDRVFSHGNQRQFHYIEERAVCHPDFWSPRRCSPVSYVHSTSALSRTVDYTPVPFDLLWYAFSEFGGPAGDDAPGADRAPEPRHLYTDGSAKDGQAGWAVVVYPEPPTFPVRPDWLLYGPVITESWDPIIG